jgi:hypothetical protein
MNRKFQTHTRQKVKVQFVFNILVVKYLDKSREHRLWTEL